MKKVNYSALRKKLQKEGEIPEWYTTAGTQLFYEKYSYQEETVKSRYESIAKAMAKHAPNRYPKWWKEEEYTKDKTWEEVFFNTLWDGYISPSTPLLSNGGLRKRGTTVACAGSFVGNNLASRYDVITEAAILTKHSHGTSCSIQEWPHEGEELKRGGHSLGTPTLVKDLIQTMNEVTQGSRRGSLAYSIKPQHGDFDWILQNLYENPESNNVGWLIDDEFIEGLKNKDEEFIEKFQKTLKVKLVRGKGYYTFIDKCNRKLAKAFKQNKLTFKASNLCVTADQRVPTNRGMLTVGELYEQGGELTLFDNNKVVNSTEMKLIEEDVDVYKITLANGMTHTVTDYHKVKTDRGMVSCGDLSLSDKVYFQTNKGLFGNRSMEDEAFLLGLYQADGTTSEKEVHISIWEDNFDLIEEIEECVDRVYKKYDMQLGENNRVYNVPKFRDCYVGESSSKSGVPIPKKNLQSRGIKKSLGFQKGIIPEWIFEADEASQWQYIKGLFFCDGTVSIGESKGNPTYLSISNTSESFLKDLQLILANLGLKFSIHLHKDEGYSKLPDGKGGYKDYYCKTCYRLVCGNKPDALTFEKNTGFLSRKGVYLEDKDYRDNTKKTSKVVSIEKLGTENVYCLTVDSEEHLWICNGIVTSNCQETILPANEEYTFSCVILNYNLELYRSWPEHLVHIGQVMSDCNVSEYLETIDQMSDVDQVAMRKIRKFTEEFRALGSGVLGWHTLMQKERLVVGSLPCMWLDKEIFSRLDKDSLEMSKWLAGVIGEPKGCKGLGIRNATRLMMPPTKSTAEIMAGASEGIGLDTAMVFTKQSAGGEFFRINKILLEIMKERGVFNDETLMRIAKKRTVKGEDWLDEHEQQVFRNAFEISMEDYLRLCSNRAKYIDQMQSINLYFTAKDSEEYISKIHRLAFEDKNIYSLYYIYSMRGSGEIEREGCASCM